MTRFITLHRTPPFAPAKGDSPPIPMLVNVAHIVTASPAQAPEPDYRSFVSVLGGDGSDIQLADEFEHVQRLIVGDDGAASLDLEQAASLIRDALSGVELVVSLSENAPAAPAMLLRDRLNAALALIGGENTMAPTTAGEPPVMSAELVAKLAAGMPCRVYDRKHGRTLDASVLRRGKAPAGVTIDIVRGLAPFSVIEDFDNTGRSVTLLSGTAWGGKGYTGATPPRFYLVAP